MNRLVVVVCLAACSSKKPAPPSDDKRPILYVAGEVIVLKAGDTFNDYRDVVTTARSIDPEVVAAAPFLYDEGTLRSDSSSTQIQIKGITPDRSPLRTELEHYLVRGTIATGAADDVIPLAIGDGVAKTLALDVGGTADVRLSWDDPTIARRGEPPPFRRVRITGVFHTGVPDYDHTLALTSFAAAQALVGRGDIALGVELALAHVEEATDIAAKLDKALGGEPYHATGWCELNKALFGC